MCLFLSSNNLEVLPAALAVQHGVVSPAYDIVHTRTTSQQNLVLPTYDVVLNRNDDDGFGFVIISTTNKNGGTIGELLIEIVVFFPYMLFVVLGCFLFPT